MARILLAEDEADLNNLIAAELRNEGHEVTQAFDGVVALAAAEASSMDIVLGLEVGADDYLTKPFRMRELMARVRASLRRKELAGTNAAANVHDGAIVVNQDSRLAQAGGEPLELTPREFDLLALFVANPGRAFSREYLLERVWASDYEVTDRTVDTHVQRLRKKLGERSSSIQTVWGIGYRFAILDS